jgi:hypothetical protein
LGRDQQKKQCCNEDKNNRGKLSWEESKEEEESIGGCISIGSGQMEQETEKGMK